MNLTDYKNNELKVLVNEGENNVGIILPSFKTSSKPITIDIQSTTLGKTVVYSLSESVPDNSIILIKNIVFYGFNGGSRKLINVSNNLTESFVIDNMYSNPTMRIHIEFDKDGVIYNIQDEITLDMSKTIELNITEPETKYLDSATLLQSLLTRMQKLENRILRLEKLNDNQ